MAELGGERWVHGCLQIGDAIRHYAALAGVELRTACRGTDYAFAQALVRAGVGISLVPSVALTRDREGLAFVRLEPPCPTRYVGVAVPRRRPTPLALSLLRALEEPRGRPDAVGRTTRPGCGGGTGRGPVRVAGWFR